jgi:hypothetical protein
LDIADAQGKDMKTAQIPWPFVALLALNSGNVLAQSSVDSRIQKLEATVRTLESRIASLEGQLREGNQPVRVAPEKVSWRKLRKGMTEGDVEQLLGSPWKITEYGTYSVWLYDYSSGRGLIHFEGKRRSVESWSEP